MKCELMLVNEKLFETIGNNHNNYFNFVLPAHLQKLEPWSAKLWSYLAAQSRRAIEEIAVGVVRPLGQRFGWSEVELVGRLDFVGSWSGKRFFPWSAVEAPDVEF